MGFAYQIVVATTAEQAWKALISPEFTRQYWFGRTVVSDWKVGSKVEVMTPEGTVEVHGKVVEFNPPQRLCYTWNSKVLAVESQVVFEVQEMGPLVKISILHDIEAGSAGFEQAASGWTFILNGFKTLLETGKPLPSIPWKKG